MELKILCIGNSFSEDTTSHLAEIALCLGFSKIKVGNLVIGGCSINRHFENASGDLPAYRFDVNEGEGWSQTPDYKISDAIKSDDWDWISIQHGTGDGSRYTEIEYYEKLPQLVAYIKEIAGEKTKIAFNMTWVGEPDFDHEEIKHYGGNQTLIYNKIAELTKNHILPMKGIDAVSPTGTAIQNARTANLGLLTRDGYHLSENVGRIIAGMTFLKALTGIEVGENSWQGEEGWKSAANKAINSAITEPFKVTEIK